MDKSKLQRWATGGINFVLVWAGVIAVLTAFDYVRREPISSQANLFTLSVWFGTWAMLILVNYLTVAAWPSKPRWVYFWIVVLLYAFVAYIGARGLQQAETDHDPFTKDQLWGTYLILAVICGPLVYMRWRKPKRPSRR